jgi:hypothetical protein
MVEKKGQGRQRENCPWHEKTEIKGRRKKEEKKKENAGRHTRNRVEGPVTF